MPMLTELQATYRAAQATAMRAEGHAAVLRIVWVKTRRAWGDHSAPTRAAARAYCAAAEADGIAHDAERAATRALRAVTAPTGHSDSGDCQREGAHE